MKALLLGGFVEEVPLPGSARKEASVVEGNGGRKGARRNRFLFIIRFLLVWSI